ncbi:Similar to ndl: Serine protease nudel (Drosophila melanogaster) [Cotesia congregata]|uniref:Similar to ndl: Serine protease nudel (Drosophila melanogaster) n=1 Tax=Cotesia congregata TaxID=51543 RepID=A0A8J2HE52_COTCN|nr:Similar to ndl: Serine protease nudel (Drosophila melanogaster) [Cotesia congregata]
MSKSFSSSSIFVVLLLFLILSGYSLCDSDKGPRRSRRILDERQHLRDILQELQKKIRLYSYAIDRFNQNTNRDLTQLKQNIVKGKKNEKRQVIGENSLSDCFQLREKCIYMIHLIRSNVQAAEIALANIKDVIWRFQLLDPSTGGLVKCLQCSQYEQDTPIPLPTSLYPADITAPEYTISDYYSYYIPPYYSNPNSKNNPATNNNNYQNLYTAPEAYGSPNTLENIYYNNQPNFYIPNLKNNPISYRVPYYNNNNSNYQFQNLHSQNNHSIAIGADKNSNLNFGSGLKVVDRMTTRDTKNKNNIKQNFSDKAIIIKDPSILKTSQFSLLKEETNQGMQSRESTSLSSKSTEDSNSVSPFMCYWPSVCFFNQVSGQQVQAPESAAIDSFPLVSRNLLSWNPANLGPNFGDYNPFISSKIPGPCPQFFGPSELVENLEGHSTVNQPVIYSHIPPYDFQEKSGYRDSGKQENKETDPRTELKNREYHFYKSAEQTTEVFINKSDEATPGEVIEEVVVKNVNSPKAAEKPIDRENLYGTVTSIYPDEISSSNQNETDLNTTLRNKENVTDDTGDAVNEMSESSTSRYDYDSNILEIDARTHKDDTLTKAFNDTWKLSENDNDFVCSNITQVVSRLLRCDKKFDCEDGTDELDCKCIDILTIKHPLSICDGRIDCADKSDELYCNDMSNSQDTYLCSRSAVFISAEKNKHESASFHYVDEKILDVHPSSEISSITFNRREVLKNISPKDSGAVMCHALYVDCSMNFNKPVYDYLYKSNLTNNETYLLPWEPAIFVDGKYHCPALLLNTEWAMASSHCTNDINLDKNITAIIAGLSMPHRYVDGPHQQTRMVNHIENLDQFHTSLLHFDKLPVTRYIKPIFINNRPLAATEGEYCQATGVNKKLEKKSVGFDGVVKDCPFCKRCFRDLLRNWCPKNGTMEKWSGFISCHNSRGWYPAAVFHEKDILCEFENPQALIGIDEMLPHLTKIMSRTVINENNFKLPNAQCDADGMKCTEGKCIPFERICNGIQDCRDGSDENEDNCLRKKDYCNDLVEDEPNNPLCDIRCSTRQLRCKNGDCISKDLFCDGYADCGDGSDEPLGCSCRDYLRLTSPHRLCNKVRDCFDKSDEAQEYCGCSNDHYECSNSTRADEEKQCIPYDFVCDGHKDCLHGEDEFSCRMVQSADDTLGAGRVLKRQLGVWFDECFSHPINSDRQASIICTTMGYSGGVLLDEKSRSAYPPPQTIHEAPYYTINLNGMAFIILKDDVPSATLVTQHNECNRAFVKCFH